MINLYNGTGVDEGNQALITDITVNLRGDTEKAVKELEAAFVPAVHGYRIPNGQGQFYCASLPMIEPSDTSDSYNKPITVSVKAVRGLE